MYTTITTREEKEVQIIINPYQKFRGRGGWDIVFDVADYDTLKHKDFKVYTTDAPFIDSITEMKEDNPSSDELDKAYIDRFFDQIEESVCEWIEELKADTNEN